MGVKSDAHIAFIVQSSANESAEKLVQQRIDFPQRGNGIDAAAEGSRARHSLGIPREMLARLGQRPSTLSLNQPRKMFADDGLLLFVGRRREGDALPRAGKFTKHPRIPERAAADHHLNVFVLVRNTAACVVVSL